MAEGKDKRTKKRYRVRDFHVEYTPDNLFSFLSKSDPERHPLVDMSTGGLQFLTAKKLKIGDNIQMTLSAPIFSAPIKVKGKVVWVQQIPRQTLYRTGVTFDGLDGAAERRLAEFEVKVQQLSIRVLCNSCGSAFKVRKQHEGARGKCPNCSKVIEIVEAVPEDKQAKSGVHVSAAAMGSLVSPSGSGIAAAAGPASDLPPSTQKFLLRACPTRTHLAIIEYLFNTKATVVSPASLAKALSEKPRVVTAACQDLVSRGLLKAVGTKAFNYAPPPDTKKAIDALMRLSRDRRKRAKLLSFVLSHEKK